METLFKLRIRGFKGEPLIIVNVWEAYKTGSHTRLDIEVRQGGKVIFERGFLYVGIPGHKAIDGDYAKHCVLSAVAMKPGDTDREYFDSYSPHQLDWANKYGDSLSCEATYRYGD